MPICPKCNNEIDHLKHHKYIDSRISYEENDRKINNSEINEFEFFNCPECNSRLFINEEKARKFLSEGKKEFGLFYCEEHRIRFNETCKQCSVKDRK